MKPVYGKRRQFLHLLTSILGGFVGAAPLAWAVEKLSLGYYLAKYPHDGMDGLGAFANALFVFCIAWIGIATALRVWLRRRLFRREWPQETPLNQRD
jgi:hypothetical protein